MQSDSNQPLALSDIMHTLSPSPGPPPEDHVEAANEESPEQPVGPDFTEAQDELDILTSDELQTMQTRLGQAGLFAVQPVASSPSSHTPLELELGHMVRSLYFRERRSVNDLIGLAPAITMSTSAASASVRAISLAGRNNCVFDGSEGPSLASVCGRVYQLGS